MGVEFGVGIEKISFYTTKYYLDIAKLAYARGVDVDKYHIGLGQEKMSIITPNEDVVTMGCEAAKDFLTDSDVSSIEMLLFATESAFDYSKSAGVYAHNLLGLNANCRVVELKQACYAATAALQFACNYVQVNPGKKCLVIASDVAWYGFKTAGEATQGCGAVAFLVSADPVICNVNFNIDNVCVNNVGDFYRPCVSDYPVVDGKLSIKSYLNILSNTIEVKNYNYCCFHLPFCTIADKGNNLLNDKKISSSNLEISKIYSKEVGNVYNASLYLSLISVLCNANVLTGERVGMFSYGSGAIGEWFEVVVNKDYKNNINKVAIEERLSKRHSISFEDYEFLWSEFQKRECTLNYKPCNLNTFVN
ncbi:MAG: hypothetical protein RL208_744, partial [Pseudomonadota bacterium]